MVKDSEINLKNSLPQGVSNEELKSLLEQNLRLLEETHEMTHKIKSYITFQRFMSIIYLVLIFGPIIFSIFYLPPLLKQAFGQYTELMNPTNPAEIIKNLKSSPMLQK